MVSKSEKSEKLRESIRNALSNHRTTQFQDITTRECESDRFNGVGVKVYGSVVHTRPIIDVIAERDGLAIESMYHCTETKESHLGVFVAYLPEQSHPAFV
jgi:hypothetical protein